MSATTSEHKKGDVVVILDAGAQYAKVIDRRVRELQVEADIKPLNTPAAELKHYKAIIISGGPQSVYGAAAPKYDPELFTLGIPILGICYGMQLINHFHKGVVAAGTVREEGISRITYDPKSRLFRGIGSVHLTTPATSGPTAVTPSMEVLLTHGDSVEQVASGFVSTATSADGICAALENESKKMYGVQFHPEVDLTKEGKEIFNHFLEIAEVSRTFTMSSRQQQAIDEIRSIVGDAKVLCLVSGGVDSSVCAALLKEAIGAEKIYALHVDSGFMRLNESSTVKTALENIGMKLEVVDASETFFNATTEIDGHQSEPLKITVQPEVKRKIIGDTFMRVSNQAIARWGLNPSEVFLAQGTLRPDLIESASHLASASGNADVIKTHHNDTALVRALRAQGKVVEPLKDYHKDEVRILGHELGLPDALIWRQPFPGPGLAIRIICADQPYLTSHDADLITQLKTYTNQHIHATLLPCRTVGVQGDGRSYRSLVGLSSTIPPTDAIWTQLFDFAHQIPKKIHGVNRVVYVFGEAVKETHFTTITPTRLVPEAIHQLQQADDIVNQVLLKYNLMKSLSQVPVVLFPVSFGEPGFRSICIRTFITNDFMTGLPAIPGLQIPAEAVNEMVTRILKTVPKIARVCYDLTAKPPATTEWE